MKKRPFKTLQSIKQSSQSQRIPLINLLIFTVILAMITTAVPLIISSKLPPEVPLFYGQADGEKQLSALIGLTVPGAIAIVLTIVNTIFVFFVKDRFLKQALLLTSFGVTLLSCITVTKVILLVGSF